MVVDLITGFLGAGKTTFIKGYFSYLQRQGLRIRMIENEFGAVNVDTRLLRETTTDVDDLAGCCMCCTGKDKFKLMLSDAKQAGYDRVLVEPSGIYDVDEFFGIMQQTGCEIGSIITIVDGKRAAGLTSETRYLMYAQLMAAGVIILSKTQLYTAADIDEALADMEQTILTYDPGAQLRAPVITKDWSEFREEDYAAFSRAGCRREKHPRSFFDHQAVYGSYMTGDLCRDRAYLSEIIDRLFTDESFGNILRVKGHLRDLDGQWYEINCTPQVRSIVPADIKRGLCVIIGQELNESRLKEAFIPRRRIKNQ